MKQTLCAYNSQDLAVLPSMFRIQTFFPQNGKDNNSYFGIMLMLTE